MKKLYKDSLPETFQALTEQRPPIIPGSSGNKKCPAVNTKNVGRLLTLAATGIAGR